MGVACNYASFILSCAEDILCLDEDADISTNGEAQRIFHGECADQKIGFFPLQTEECLNVLLEKESEHLPARDYAKRLMSGALDVSARKDAINWIQEVHTYHNFGPLSAFLSVNYMDRFLSTHELQKGQAWMMQLLAVTCLSLAVKMEETDAPLYMDLQIGNAKYVFEARTIQRMELLVLSSLKWRMQPVTPFSFMDYFLQKFINGNAINDSVINRCIYLILGTIKGIGLLEFRPSEVAAAAALAALTDAGMVAIDMGLSCCSFLEKEKVMRCYESLKAADFMERPASSSSLPQSPIGVLDAATLSYNSDEAINSSQETSESNSPASKRRKMTSASSS